MLLQFKKYYVMIPFIVIIFALSACTKKEAVVVVNNSVKADNDDKVVENKSVDSGLYTEKLSTSSATDKIKLVDKKYSNFWDSINSNYIDDEYNNTKIIKDNVRLGKKANVKYAEAWLSELEATYKYICEHADKDLVKSVESQYKEFTKYYEASKSLYAGVITVKNNYAAEIDGNNVIKQFYALADDVREYTVLLKEYIYLISGKVEFYTEDKASEIKTTKYTTENNKINLLISKDAILKDILNDNYSKKINCSLNKTSEKIANTKTKKYVKYWKEELDNNYEKLAKEFNTDDRELLKEQRDAYIDYISESIAINKKILMDTGRFKTKYKESIKAENNLYKGKGYMKYNTLLVEYYYVLTDKIDL